MVRNEETEVIAIELVIRYYQNEYEIKDVHKDGIGADLRLLKKDVVNPEPIYIEVKGMYQREPTAFEIYKTDKERAENCKMFFWIVYDLYENYGGPKAYIIDGKKILEWITPNKRGNFSVLGIKQKIKDAGLEPISLKEFSLF